MRGTFEPWWPAALLRKDYETDGRNYRERPRGRRASQGQPPFPSGPNSRRITATPATSAFE
jgi:hypothetical protein